MESLKQNGYEVLKSRYLLSDETPTDLFRRVAIAVSRAEINYATASEHNIWEQRFYDSMASLDFLPNSPTLMNAGTNNGQLSACFVLPVEDNLDAIFTTLKQATLIQRSGGGTGFNFSKLRPAGDSLTGVSGTAAGPVAFMKIFNEATENVKQGGKRRGANMAILNIDHPDIEKFMEAKLDEGELNNFNFSVGITDAFMKAVQRNVNWHLMNPRTGNIEKTVPARKLWHNIAECAWKVGDPGAIFLDRLNECTPTPMAGKITATNPCGEMPLLDYESCNLGSINLSNLLIIKNGKQWVNFNRLSRLVNTAVRFLDNVIDVNYYPLPEIEKITKANRKIGLGVMGWADLLIQLGIPYASQEAVELGEHIMKFIRNESVRASAKLAEERGNFPAWESSTYCPGMPLRNATRTSIAPTGSISLIAGVSSSIEPLFLLSYQRSHVLNEELLPETNPHFISYLKSHNLYTRALMRKVQQTGSVVDVVEIPNEAKLLFKTALEIPYAWHLKHQEAFQKYTDNAVSKTINMPFNTTVEQVGKVFDEAWKLKLKGITVYRYGSKSKQVLKMNSGDRACKVCEV